MSRHSFAGATAEAGTPLRNHGFGTASQPSSRTGGTTAGRLSAGPHTKVAKAAEGWEFSHTKVAKEAKNGPLGVFASLHEKKQPAIGPHARPRRILGRANLRALRFLGVRKESAVQERSAASRPSRPWCEKRTAGLCTLVFGLRLFASLRLCVRKEDRELGLTPSRQACLIVHAPASGLWPLTAGLCPLGVFAPWLFNKKSLLRGLRYLGVKEESASGLKQSRQAAEPTRSLYTKVAKVAERWAWGVSAGLSSRGPP